MYSKTIYFLVLCFILASCTLNPKQSIDLEPEANYWAPMGTFLSGSGVNGSDADGADIALDSNGYPVVAWHESNGNVYNLYVKRWDGTAWQWVGGAISAVGGQTDSFKPSLALDSSGNPVVAYQEDDGSVNNIYVSRWTGSAWQLLGGALSAVAGGTGAYEPSLAIDSLNNPVVAWREQNPTTTNIFVRRFSAGAWQAVGGALSAVAGATDAIEPSLKLDGSGNPVVAWQESDGTNSNIYVYRYTGTWQIVGGALSGSGAAGSSAFSPSLDLDSAYNPVVAWRESSGTGTAEDVYVYKFSSGVWQPVGTALSAVTGTTNVGNPYLILDSANKPVVAWDEIKGASNDVYVRRWSGSVWQGVGGRLSAIGNNTDAFEPAVTLDSAGNPIVAWSENNGNVFNIYVQQYFKNVWINAGSPVDMSLAQDATMPAIAVNSADQPFLAWTENTPVNAHDIYAKVWNGTAWILAGTALDRTLSNDVSAPAIATHGLIPYIAWGELNGTEYHVYASQWNGASWTALGASLDEQISRDANYPSVDAGVSGPVVAWQECASTASWDTCTDYDIRVKKWNSSTSTWDSLGSILDNVPTNDATHPSLALKSNGNPVVAWQERNGTSTVKHIVIKEWDGNTWISLGIVNVSLSQDASFPSLVINNIDQPIIAWQQKVEVRNPPSTSYSIYVKR